MVLSYNSECDHYHHVTGRFRLDTVNFGLRITEHQRVRIFQSNRKPSAFCRGLYDAVAIERTPDQQVPIPNGATISKCVRAMMASVVTPGFPRECRR